MNVLMIKYSETNLFESNPRKYFTQKLQKYKDAYQMIKMLTFSWNSKYSMSVKPYHILIL